MSVLKYGLTTKIALLTLAVALVLMAAIALALFSFKQYRTTLNEVADRELQALMTATRLVQQAESLVNASAMLLLAENHFSRRQAVFEVEDRQEWIGRLVTDLSTYPGDQIDFQAIHQTKDELVGNLARMNTLVEERINLRADVYFRDRTSQQDLERLELIDAEIGEMIRANRELSQDLTVTVGHQVSLIRSSILSSVETINQGMTLRQTWLLYSGILALLVVFLTAFYINRSVVQRIINLQRALSLDRPRAQDVPVEGDDEIAWMAQSIHRYVNKINAHEGRIMEMNEELSFLATHDALTKLYNRHYFDRHLNQLSQKDESESFCIAMLDIDHFKSINDNHGHDAGDQVIRMLAEELKAALPEAAMVARVGGEEFAVVFQKLSLKTASQYLERLRLQIEQLPIHVAGVDLRVTASIGLAGYCQDRDLIACLKSADMALYEAKRLGRNQLVVHTISKEGK
ncbi:diguanylate cyclase (GGDEF) domain-containing protein [Marinospirillum celere]|uniref:diguanylate cyclase n=1 Tax=Marinospirillum celere TaxID=1122252 RepID=A0A1I1E9Y2_9GAMM|nr:GGDEF domain-containing protein [Marinospirillum celere]SFB81830.1 diguanylate cyclase (GGDEF) domain-containing protein [Marinospirillum celere]